MTNVLVSPAYKALLVKTHAVTKKWGNGGKGHLDEVIAWRDKLRAASILDYGCGSGSLKPAILEWHAQAKATAPYQCFPEADVREYDPGIIGKDAPPMPADLVVCTDVLEHVEKGLVVATLKHLRTLAQKGVFLGISLNPAKLILPDGRNAHLSVHDESWWLEWIKATGFKIKRHERRKNLMVWAV